MIDQKRFSLIQLETLQAVSTAAAPSSDAVMRNYRVDRTDDERVLSRARASVRP